MVFIRLNERRDFLLPTRNSRLKMSQFDWFRFAMHRQLDEAYSRVHLEMIASIRELNEFELNSEH